MKITQTAAKGKPCKDPPAVSLTPHLVLAVSLAILLSLLLAAGLMGLVFFSAESGHDRRVADENAAHEPEVWRDPPPG